MVDRRQVLAGIGATVLGAAGKTGFDALTNEENPEVDASFTGVNGDIDDWELTGEIFVQAGTEDAEVTGYIDDRVQVKQEGLSAGEQETYNLSVKGQELGNATIEALVRAGGNQHRDKEEFNVGMEDINQTDNSSDDNSGSDGSSDDFSYNFGDLPYDSIADGLAYQSDSAIDAFDDEVVEAFFNRDEDSQEVVDDAYIDVEDSTTREYLEASSGEREDIDVFLGFENGSEGTKLRGSASAGMNEDFEEYMVGLNHLGRFDSEMEEYMQEVEDMLD